MKILITGQTGFLGYFLSSYLESQNHEVTGINSQNCDLRNFDKLSNFTNIKFDEIYHLAAWTQAGDFCLHHPGEQWIINQQINASILRWWAEIQPQAKLITMGTSCSYDPSLDLIEENYLIGTPIESLYTYAHTKRMMEIGLRSLSNQFNLKYLTVVPSTLYGPQYHLDGRQMHFIFDLIRKIMLGKYRGDEVVLWGDGHQERELVFIDDFINDLVALNSMASNEIFNIGANTSHTIREFAEQISSIIGFDNNKIKYDTSKYVGAKSKSLKNHKLINTIGELHRTSIEDGLTKTIDWFENNFDKFLAENNE